MLKLRKVGWSIRAGGIWVRVGGTVCNTLKGGGTEKRGGDTKILKRGRQAGSRGGVPYKGAGDGAPLRTMPTIRDLRLQLNISHEHCKFFSKDNNTK